MNKLLTSIICLGFSTLLSLATVAQEDEIRRMPGYVDFGSLTAQYGEPSVEINLGESLLKFVGSLASNDDPEAAALINGLQAVRVNVYKTEGDPSVAISHINDVAATLGASRWEQVVKVNDEDENVRILMKMNGDAIGGLTVMAAGDDDEAVFINIIGNLDPANIGTVMDKFNVDVDLD